MSCVTCWDHLLNTHCADTHCEHETSKFRKSFWASFQFSLHIFSFSTNMKWVWLPAHLWVTAQVIAQGQLISQWSPTRIRGMYWWVIGHRCTQCATIYTASPPQKHPDICLFIYRVFLFASQNQHTESLFSSFGCHCHWNKQWHCFLVRCNQQLPGYSNPFFFSPSMEVTKTFEKRGAVCWPETETKPTSSSSTVNRETKAHFILGAAGISGGY